MATEQKKEIEMMNPITATDDAIATPKTTTDPISPWTTTQKVVTALLLCLYVLGTIVGMSLYNRTKEAQLRPDKGIPSSIFIIGGIVAILLTLVPYVARKHCCATARIESEQPTPVIQTISFKSTISIHSIPYQLWLGCWAIVSIGTWINKLENITLVDQTHCFLLYPKYILGRVKIIDRPYYINYTAVLNCELDQWNTPESTGKPPQFESSWYVVEDQAMVDNWNNYLLDTLCTVIFGVHVTIVGMYHVYQGLTHNNEVHFSYWNLLSLDQGLWAMDALIIFSTLMSFANEGAVYNSYLVFGTLRFLLLFHPLFMFEHYLIERKAQQRYGRFSVVGSVVVASSKLVFVCLMGAAVVFMAELPCKVVMKEFDAMDSCDDSFKSFANVVYFTFVTLSTVGYGDMSPKTPIGRVLIIVVILFGIAYLPGAISDVIHMSQNAKDEEIEGIEGIEGIERVEGDTNPEKKGNSLLLHLIKEVHALKKEEEKLIETLKYNNNKRQIGFFQHGGTLHANATRNSSSSSSNDDDDNDDNDNTSSNGEVKTSVVTVAADSIKSTSKASRLMDIHGKLKISLCLAVLGLDPEGGGELLVSHVLGNVHVQDVE